MKRSQWILRVILVGALVSPGCGGGPTTPIGSGGSGGTAPSNPAVGLNLTGTWTGTIQFYVGSCPIEPVSVVLTQADSAGANGTHFGGQFATPCGGPVQISGILNAGRLYGTLTDSSDNERLTGTATATDIKIRSLQGTGGVDGEADVTKVINAIVLHR